MYDITFLRLTCRKNVFGQNQCSLFKKSLKQSDNHKPLIEEAQCNGQKKKDKMTNNDLPNSTQKTKD